MLTRKHHMLFWFGLLAATLLFLLAVSDILLPFVVGALVAYFLDPVADFFESKGLSRGLSTAVIILTFFIAIIIMTAFLIPFISEQLLSLVQKMPDYIESIKKAVIPQAQVLVEKYKLNINLEEATNGQSDTAKYALGVATAFLKNTLESGAAFLSILSLIFISPIVSFYMLRDWDVMNEKIYSWFPKKHKLTIEMLISEMDETLSGFVRGYTNICLILGFYYGTTLALIGLDYGFTIGFLTGLLSFIPFVGVGIGMTVGLLVAYFQFGFEAGLFMVLAAFLIGQFVEGNFITPKLVGEKVGLHPVWIIFALLAAGTLFGFAGVIVAIPVAAIIGVLFRYLLNLYLKSNFYYSSQKKRAAAKKKTA